MTSHSRRALTLLLLLALLLPQVLSAGITNLAPRSLAPVVPDANDPAFRKVILNKVNTYRSYQDASALQYDADLATYAAGLANQCDIEPEVDARYGDIVTGGSPSIFGQNSWDGLTLNEAAADLIDGWYNANASYIADPTFQFLPFGRSYTQLVWKATTHVGCSWTPPASKFDASSALYLRCAFAPKGNVEGYFEENVSCNDCLGHAQAGVSAEPADLRGRQTTGSAFGDLCLVKINSMRAKAGVPLLKWHQESAVLAKTLAQKCNGSPQQGETVGTAISSPPGYIPTWDATFQTLDAWDGEPHTTDRAKSPNYARIIAKDPSSFGCGWNDNICPGSKWFMHCFFGNWGAGLNHPKEERQAEENSISTRQSGRLNINMDDYSVTLMWPINGIRKDAGLPEVKWSHSLVVRTNDRGARCSDFRGLSIGQLVQTHWWPKLLNPNPDFVLLSSVAGWNKTKPAGGEHASESSIPDFVKITQPQWTSVGCSWSRNCTAADDYILYCEFSELAPTRRAINEDQTLRQEVEPWLQNFIGQALADARQEAGLEQPEITFSKAQATQAQIDADKCNGAKDDVLSPQAVYRYAEARGKLTKQNMTANALAIWFEQKSTLSRTSGPDYDVITQKANGKFGCAWSTKCGSTHYLYCNFFHK